MGFSILVECANVSRIWEISHFVRERTFGPLINSKSPVQLVGAHPMPHVATRLMGCMS
jgi:hypothetical protein